MDRQSLKYKEKRKEMSLSREKAAEMLAMSDDKLERIENGRQIPYPEDVLLMSEKYGSPELCNYYCSHQCAIGEKFTKEIPAGDLPSIVVKLLDSIYDVEDIDKLLVGITADEKISEEEIPDMAMVQYTLEQLSIMTEALKMNIRKKMSSGEIDKEAYEEAYRTVSLSE